jgi:hypothetical protein
MDTELDRLFDALNRELFAARLPKHRVRTGPAQHGELGFLDEATSTIWLCDPPDIRSTLLHEMCHIGTPGHGRLFRAKLRRLAALGESWAQRERAYYLRQELRMGARPWIALWEVARDLRGGVLSRA